MSHQRPNIVLVMADQLGAKFLGCYGSGVGSTPVLDGLAREGVRFTRFYAACPLCAPNRASILTGRSPEIHGVVTNNLAFPADMPTYAQVLGQAGYRTAGFGKFHQTPMQWAPPSDVRFLGFEESVVHEDPKWGPWLDWVRARHPTHYRAALAMVNGHGAQRGSRPDGERRQGASETQIRQRAEAFPEFMTPRLAASPWDRMYPSPLPPEVHDATFITDLALDYVRRRAAAADGRPFLCHVSYVDPHDPYDPPEPYASMFDADAMPAPAAAEWLAQGPALLDTNRDGYLAFRTIADNVAAVRRLRAFYHGSLRFLDDQIGRLVAGLRESGQWANTLLVFTTDHGDMLGDHGLIAKGLPHYDAAIRCPLIVAGGAVRPGVSDQLAGSLDLFPTLCDWAGLPPGDRPPCEGLSLASACAGTVEVAERSEIAVSGGEADTVLSRDGWRLTRYLRSEAGQLFDLRADPDEQANRYQDPACRDRKIELLERLVRARQAPRQMPSYRALPARDGRRWLVDAGRSVPAQPLTLSPWVQEGPRPEWRGTDPFLT